MKTNFVLDWLADQELRARVGRQLNKGEQLHALRRAIFYANEGHVRQRTPEQQGEQALCLSIVVNAIIVWNTVYIQRVLDELRAAGELITTSEIEHISPLAHQHIHLYGHYPFDLATRPDGHRPLRTPAAPAAPAPNDAEPRLTLSVKIRTVTNFGSQGRRLSARAVDLVVRSVAARAELKLSAHTLRHTCVTNLVRSGNDLVLVAELAGHRRLETTRRYSLPSAADRQAAMDALEIED